MDDEHTDSNFAFKITNLAGKELLIYADGYVKGLNTFFVKLIQYLLLIVFQL